MTRLRRTLLLLGGLCAADVSLPWGFSHGFLEKNRLFPTNLTRVYASVFVEPESPLAVMVVSMSDPRFWVLGLAVVTALFLAFRRGSRRARGLALAQAGLFFSAEFLLPWLTGNGLIPFSLANVLFPVPDIPRVHGRVFGWVHLPALFCFLGVLLDTRRPVHVK